MEDWRRIVLALIIALMWGIPLAAVGWLFRNPKD